MMSKHTKTKSILSVRADPEVTEAMDRSMYQGTGRWSTLVWLTTRALVHKRSSKCYKRYNLALWRLLLKRLLNCSGQTRAYNQCERWTFITLPHLYSPISIHLQHHSDKSHSFELLELELEHVVVGGQYNIPMVQSTSLHNKRLFHCSWF